MRWAEPAEVRAERRRALDRPAERGGVERAHALAPRPWSTRSPVSSRTSCGRSTRPPDTCAADHVRAEVDPRPPVHHAVRARARPTATRTRGRARTPCPVRPRRRPRRPPRSCPVAPARSTCVEVAISGWWCSFSNTVASAGFVDVARELHSRVERARLALVQDRLTRSPCSSSHQRSRIARRAVAAAAVLVGARRPRRRSAEVQVDVAARDLAPARRCARPCPRSSSTARSQKRRPRPCRGSRTGSSCPRRAAGRRRRSTSAGSATSPTASTSSIRRMSASTWTITENASRTCMPDE